MHKALPIVYVTDEVRNAHEAYMPLCLEEAYIAVTMMHPEVATQGLSVTVTSLTAFDGGMAVNGKDYYIMEHCYE